MQQLNSTTELWKAAGQPNSQASPLAGAEIDPGNLPTEDPESPVCCWNICAGIHEPDDKVRIRHRPASD